MTDHADDERITTKPGRVELADTVAGKSIVWILDVTASVNRSLIGDEHLSMSVKSGEESKSSRERRLCVRRLGDCPVGDHLAIVIHLFHNDMLMKTIPELRMTALRATNPRQRWHCPVDENAEVWRDLYAIIEERPAADIEYLTTAHPMPRIFTNPPYSTPPWDCEGARNFILNLDSQVMLDMVRRIYELDPDLLHNLTTENRRQMFLG
ncbi:MAG: hypothetical protein VYB40_02210, partial [Candidatus Thermoplasmatota archaeon]|nr:hypothetical protein [Candidatus Thermoplasmatota archaeon]